MASQTLTTVAQIVGNDRLSGVISGMAAKVQAQQSRITKSFQTMNAQLSSLPIMGGALSGAFAAKNVFGDEVAWSKQVQLFKAISGIGEDWKGLEKTIYDVSNTTSESREKVLGTAKAWVELGGSVKSINKDLLLTYTNFSRLAEIDSKSAMKESRAFGIAYKMDVNDPKVMKQIEDLLIVAIKKTPGGGEAMMEYLKKAAPVGGTLHIAQEKLVALGTMMMREGFQGGDAGRAVNTGLLRMQTMSKEVRRELEAANVKLQDMYDTPFREGGMVDTQGMRRRLAGGGYMSPAADAAIARFEKRMGAITEAQVESGEFDLDTPIRELKMELGKSLKKSGLNPDTISKLVDQQVASSMGNLDLDKTLDTLGKLPLASRAKLLGKEHFPKWEPLVQNRKMLLEIEAQYAPDKTKGALDKMTAELNQGFGFQWTRFTNILHNALMGNFGMGDNSVAKDFADMFKAMGDAMISAQHVNPEVFRKLFWGFAGMAALPVGVFALRAMGGALATVGALAWAPIRALGALNAMPYARTAAGMAAVSAAMSKRGGVLGMSAGAVGLLGKGVGFMGTLARFTGYGLAIAGAAMLYEHWDAISGAAKEWWSGYGQTDAGKKMAADWGTLKGSLKELSGAATEAGIAILGVFGYESGKDAQGKAKSGTAALLDALAQLLDSLIQKATTLTKILTKLVQLDLPGAMSVLDDPEWRAKKRAETSPLQEKGNQLWQEWNGGPWGMFRQKYIDPILPKGWEKFPELDFSPDEYWRKLGYPKRMEPQPEAERIPQLQNRTPGGMPLSFLPFTPFGPGDKPVITIDPNTNLKATIEQAVPVTVTTAGRLVVEVEGGGKVKENSVYFKGDAGASPPATGNGTGMGR